MTGERRPGWRARALAAFVDANAQPDSAPPSPPQPRCGQCGDPVAIGHLCALCDTIEELSARVGLAGDAQWMAIRLQQRRQYLDQLVEIAQRGAYRGLWVPTADLADLRNTIADVENELGARAEAERDAEDGAP